MILKVTHNEYYTSQEWTHQENDCITCQRGSVWYWISDERCGKRHAQRGTNDGSGYLGIVDENVKWFLSPPISPYCYFDSIEKAVECCERDYCEINRNDKT